MKFVYMLVESFALSSSSRKQSSENSRKQSKTVAAVTLGFERVIIVWCRDSTGLFPVMSQKRHKFPLFSGLTLFVAFAVHLAALAGPEAGLLIKRPAQGRTEIPQTREILAPTGPASGRIAMEKGH